MSDISNVLRKVIELDISLGLDGTQEALDEITRLTAEVKKLKADLAFADAQCAKIEGLFLGTNKENEKLRAALEPFVCDCKSNCEWERDEVCPDWNARAALPGDKHE